MAIIKQAKNIKIITSKKDVVITGNLSINTQKKMTFDDIEDNLYSLSVQNIKPIARG